MMHSGSDRFLCNLGRSERLLTHVRKQLGGDSTLQPAQSADQSIASPGLISRSRSCSLNRKAGDRMDRLFYLRTNSQCLLGTLIWRISVFCNCSLRAALSPNVSTGVLKAVLCTTQKDVAKQTLVIDESREAERLTGRRSCLRHSDEQTSASCLMKVP